MKSIRHSERTIHGNSGGAMRSSRPVLLACLLLGCLALAVQESRGQGWLPIETAVIASEDGATRATASAKVSFAVSGDSQPAGPLPGVVEVTLQLDSPMAGRGQGYAQLVLLDRQGAVVYSTPVLERHAAPEGQGAAPAAERFEVPSAALAQMRAAALMVRAREGEALAHPSEALGERLQRIQTLYRQGNEVPDPDITIYSL